MPAMQRPSVPDSSQRSSAQTRGAVGALVVIALALAAPAAAAAQSLRCNGYLIGKGDSPASLLQRCGEPLLRQAVCPSMLQLGWVALPYRPDGTGAVIATQCVPMEEWTYDQGPGNFLGVVRIHNGAVESVRNGGKGR